LLQLSYLDHHASVELLTPSKPSEKLELQL